MKIVLISPSGNKESEVGSLVKMFEMGLQTYHIRKVKYSTRQLKEFIEAIPKKYHDRLVLHTHHELAMKYNLKGVYISRSHKKRKYRTWLRMKWFRFRKPELEVSCSIRSIEGLQEPNPKYKYVFLTPVFDSLSGNFQAAFSEQHVQTALKHTAYAVLARGGISVYTFQRAHELGFAGAAFYSGIWKAEKPVEEFRKVMEKLAELDLPME